MAPFRNNAPCPCGSGTKYKHCCKSDMDADPKPRGAEAVPVAQGWLYEHHPREMKAGFAETVFAGLDMKEVIALTLLPDDLVRLIDYFGREVTLAEGVLDLDGRDVPCLDLVLGPDGPPFDAAQREYLQLLGRRWMSLYQVVEPKPGSGFRVRDLLDDDEPVLWVEAPAISQGLVAAEGSIFGARLMPGEHWTHSGPVIPQQQPHVFKTIEQIKDERLREPDEERRTRSMLIVFAWLFPLTRTSPELIESVSAGLRSVS